MIDLWAHQALWCGYYSKENIHMKKPLKVTLALCALAVVFALWLRPSLESLYTTIRLFEPDRIVNHFRSFDDIWPTRPMPRPAQSSPYPVGDAIELPESFTFGESTLNTKQFLADAWTTGLLVVQDDQIVYEAYFLGNDSSTRNISWSMAKSFISALIGVAVNEGKISSIEQPVDAYATELKGSGYEGVRIKDVLQMSSGVAFNEDYGDFNSDINRWGRGFALGHSQDEFAASLIRERPPGMKHQYVSIDTHVLGMVLTRATGQSVSQYMEEKLYQPMGMEYDGYWIIDGHGMEMALGGLNLTLRDFAKLGSMYLHQGKAGEKQVVPAEWVAASTRPDGPHVQPGSHLGYGYQWWIPGSSSGEYMAMGVYGQYIYVNPVTRTVIVKLAANPHYNEPDYIPSSNFSNLALFRAIATGGAD